MPSPTRAAIGAHAAYRSQIAEASSPHAVTRGPTAFVRRGSSFEAHPSSRNDNNRARRTAFAVYVIDTRMRRPLLAISVVLALAPRARAEELPTAAGPNGVLHTPSAIGGEAWTARGALLVDWFSASNFLCTNEHPCGTSTSDEHRHTGATVVAGATLFRGLDAYLATRAYSNDSSQSADLFEVIGDTTLGARYARAVSRLLHLGGGAEAILTGAPGSVGIGGAGTSARLRAISTLDVSPVRVHLGLAYLFDNTFALVRDIERERGAPISRVERYGLGINKVDRFEVNVGAELLAAGGHVRPFIEYGFAIATRRHGASCANAVDAEPCRATFGAMPSNVTLGARVAPVLFERATVSFLLALDLGLTSRFASEVAPNAPYTLWLGVSMALPMTEKPPKVVTERVEVGIPPPFVTMRGFVHVAGEKTPIPNAIVTFVDVTRPPLATDEKGHFGDEVPPGTYEVKVHADGYQDNTCGGTAVAAGKSQLLLDCPLERLLRSD